MKKIARWGAEWYSRNALNGVSRYVMFISPNQPALFRTRAEARAWISEIYGYIKGRRDLRDDPHGWRMPRAVQVQVTLRVVGRRPSDPSGKDERPK